MALTDTAIRATKPGKRPYKFYDRETTQRLLQHQRRERTIAAVSADLGHDEGFVALAFEAQA